MAVLQENKEVASTPSVDLLWRIRLEMVLGDVVLTCLSDHSRVKKVSTSRIPTSSDGPRKNFMCNEVA